MLDKFIENTMLLAFRVIVLIFIATFWGALFFLIYHAVHYVIYGRPA